MTDTTQAPLRAGVIGVGHLGKIHARLWGQTSGAALAGVYDTDPARAEEIARENGTTAYRSLPELLGAVQAVSIVTPTSTHAGIATQAIEAGVHCFIEKPITAHYAEATALDTLAHSKGITVQVGHVERFNAALLAVAGMAGEPQFIESHRLSQFSPRALDVSVIHDLMIHDIDLTLWLVKSPVTEIRASGVGVLSDSIDIANARLEFANGCVANLTASRISQRSMRKMRMFGRDSYISLDFAAPSAEVFRISDGAAGAGTDAVAGETLLGGIEYGALKKAIHYQKLPTPQVNAIALELHEFVSAIEHGTVPPVTAAAAAEALRIAGQIFSLCNHAG